MSVFVAVMFLALLVRMIMVMVRANKFEKTWHFLTELAVTGVLMIWAGILLL